MARVRYAVAASLDGYIAGPEGEIDWITQDPDIDFGAWFDQFETFLVGRRTYEAMVRLGQATIPGKRLVVVSTTLRPEDHPGVTVVSEGVAERLGGLRADSDTDLWLFGGGGLFASLLELGLVDTVEVAVIPVVLGDGIPLLAGPFRPTGLRLTGHRLYPKTGIMSLEYAVVRSP